jgi:hypothetical protein
MEFSLFVCPQCPDSPTYYTTDALASHRLAAHERALDVAASETRLAFEANRVGRARLTPWQADFTHWHQARIAGRVLAPEVLHAD